MKRWTAGLLFSLTCALPCLGELQARPFPEIPRAGVRALADGWIETVGEAQLSDITPDEARARALQAAREEAIAFALGIDISSLDYVYKEEGTSFRESFLSLSRQISSGRIVAERPVQWTAYEVPADPLPISVYQARVQVRVEQYEGQPDPDFGVSVRLNKENFTDGEPMRLAITATLPCYISVLNITATDTVVVLLPHPYRPTGFVEPGDTLWVPDEEEQAMGISYRVQVPEGRRQATEQIMVVAMKTEHTLGAGWSRTGLHNQVPTRKAALVQLMRWLVKVPRQEWTEAGAAYRVQAAKP